jgi:hypothetical protein
MSPSRRHFFFGSLLAGAVPAAGFGSSASLKSLGYKSPSEKLNIAAIGSGGKGYTDINGCTGENIVALCDPDDKRAERTFKLFPNTPKYKDFRVMLDKHKEIDAVLVSCPDHVHATASMWAMSRGKHVYCQKPLTRTVWEAQQLTAAAAKYGVATQMGNQGYSNPGARECAEIIWSGEIGNVTEMHAWTDRPGRYWPQNPDVDPKPEPVPAHLDWQAWLAASPDRPYSPAIAPHHWRAFPEYGCGAIGDMACHIMGTPNMALRLAHRGAAGVFCGDAIHHPLQVCAPDWNSRFCEDPQLARRTRWRLLSECAEHGHWLFPTHFGAPHVAAIQAQSDTFVPRFVEPGG